MSDLQTSFVLLDRAVTPDMSAIAKALRSRHPELRVDMVVDSSTGSLTSHLLRCGDETIAVLPMPTPIPQDPALWRRAATTWPGAEAVAARHQGHVIVSSLGDSSHPLSGARTVTAVIGAPIAVTPGCCGVVWRAKVARSAKVWLEMSRQSFAPYPDYPFTLWVDVLPFRSSAMIGAVTMGVSVFAGREIEFETEKLSAPDVIDNVLGLAAYLVEHGPVLKDGDTFGGDAAERFSISFKQSDDFPGLPVYFCSPMRGGILGVGNEVTKRSRSS